MENLRPVDNQRLLNALESLSVSIGFVSTAVEMVRDALLASSAEATSEVRLPPLDAPARRDRNRGTVDKN